MLQLPTYKTLLVITAILIATLNLKMKTTSNFHAISQCHPTASFIFLVQIERALTAKITHCSLSVMQHQRLPSTCAHSIWV